jgi:PepSY-associated TM region
MRALIFFHRWLGIPFCLLFAMWFATGIVMHFVPFPALTEMERLAGLPPVEPASLEHGPADAVLASKLAAVARVRLWQRSDGPTYLVTGATGLRALHAADLTPAAVGSDDLALAIAVDHGRRRGMDVARAVMAERADYDQWTVPNGLDPHRPLYRIALNDTSGTELYVSSTTGEVVRDTTGSERAWNYAGSVVHWIYPTVLRKDWRVWNVVVWWLALLAMFAAITGVVLGPLRLKLKGGRVASPFRRWHGWHHWLGLGTMIFVLTWIVSGWLSMDHGRLFTEGKLTEAETDMIVGTPAWATLSAAELQRVPASAREIEWFALGGMIYRRERTAFDAQRLSLADTNEHAPVREFLRPDEVGAATVKLAAACLGAAAVPHGDNYAMEAEIPDAPVYRTVCDEVWYHIDGASGAVLEKLDPSRRSYRWFYSALHTFDLPALMARPWLRTSLIISLCAIGFVFSVTGIVIGWRRLRLQLWRLRPRN